MRVIFIGERGTTICVDAEAIKEGFGAGVFVHTRHLDAVTGSGIEIWPVLIHESWKPWPNSISARVQEAWKEDTINLCFLARPFEESA